MSTVESNALQPTSSPGRTSASTLRGISDAQTRQARAFLIHLISREIQLSSHVAGWLRSVAEQLVAERLTDRQLTELSADCVRLAAETWELREQLVAVAHRLVARRNRGLSHRRINVMQLLEQPLSPEMLTFIDFNGRHAKSGAALAVVSSVEQLLSGVVPLAIDLAGIADSEADNDLSEVSEVYEGRYARAEALRRLTTTLASAMPEWGAAMQEAGDTAIELYTEIIRESAELAPRFDVLRT